MGYPRSGWALAALLLLASLLAPATAAVSATGERPNRWRHVDAARLTPHTLAEAGELHAHARHQAHKEMLRAGHRVNHLPAAQPSSCVGSLGTVDPVASFGADPTGRRDSTQALTQAMTALTNTSAHAPDAMADCIANLGGATLDLGGGEFLISAPLIIPPHVGNVRIRGGTLRASPSFPPTRFLVEIGQAGCTTGCGGKVEKQKVCNEMIGLESLFFDASHIAAGGVLSQATMGTTVGPSCFFIGFVEAGLRVMGGHETILSDSWLAEYYWSDKHDPTTSRSIAVELNGQDNFVSNVIVFDYAKLGVLVNGAATILTGVHTWNGGGVGISINGSYGIQDRIIDCYLDYNSLDLVQPSATTVKNTFFLDTKARIFPDPSSSTAWSPKPKQPSIEAVVFRENTYNLGEWGGNESIVVVSSEGDDVTDKITPAQCQRFVVEDEISLSPAKLRQTRATQTLWQRNATEFRFDFSKQLIFPWIDTIVQYTVMLPRAQGQWKAPLVQHAAEMPQGSGEAVAVVRLSEPSDATVTIEVVQCVSAPGSGDHHDSGGGDVAPTGQCAATLTSLCHGARQSSKGNCFICCGQHHQELVGAACSQPDFDSFCQ